MIKRYLYYAFLICLGILLGSLIRAASGAEPVFVKLSPKVTVTNKKPILTDILTYTRNPFNGEDVINTAHETTHQINSETRNSFRGNVNAFYVLEGRAVVLVEPKITLKDVADAIPPNLRVGPYDLYLVQMRVYWNEQPLYILDEWVAYTNGTLVGREYNLGRSTEFSAEQARWFDYYARIMVEVIKVKDPNYPYLKDLENFIIWNRERGTLP